jgi:hypothetical protein
VRDFEWVTVGFYTYCVIAALVAPALPARRRAAIVFIAMALGGLAAFAPLAPWRNSLLLRDWILPAIAYLLGGYYLSGLFYVAPMPRLETRLVALDRRLGAAAWSSRLPLAAVEFLEVSYLAVYAMVGLGPLVAYAAAGVTEVERYWTIILTADYICFACMPWAQTRTPHSLVRTAAEPHGPRRLQPRAQYVPERARGRGALRRPRTCARVARGQRSARPVCNWRRCRLGRRPVSFRGGCDRRLCGRDRCVAAGGMIGAHGRSTRKFALLAAVVAVVADVSGPADRKVT